MDKEDSPSGMFLASSTGFDMLTHDAICIKLNIVELSACIWFNLKAI